MVASEVSVDFVCRVPVVEFAGYVVEVVFVDGGFGWVDVEVGAFG